MSKRKLRLREEARAEFLQQAQYYQDKRDGLGRKFRESVGVAMDPIRRFSQGGAPGPLGTRRTKVRGFPFTINCRDTEAEVLVYAVAPDLQQPGYWISRTALDEPPQS